MPLTGTLRDLSLPNLVQLQCSEHKHTQVLLARGVRTGTLIFAEGALIYASVDDKVGEDAIYELLTWEEGDFRVDNENVTTQRNMTTPWSAILLEGLRRLDEARAERNAALEAALRGMKGKHGLRSAVAVTANGAIRATATEQHPQESATLVTLVAGRAEIIGTVLGLGAPSEILATSANEKVWIRKYQGDYLGCWLEGRATLESLRAMLQTPKNGQ